MKVEAFDGVTAEGLRKSQLVVLGDNAHVTGAWMPRDTTIVCLGHFATIDVRFAATTGDGHE